MLVGTTQGHGATVAEAIHQSQRSGKPIFAVAGASYCPACVKLMKTLNTDETLQPFVEQFVPLKINANSNDYARWKKFFPPERAAIPALFIVTPQGKELYSAVGALPTQSLQKVLLTSLEKAGRYPSQEQWEKITASLKSAEEHLREGKVVEAGQVLQPTLATLTQMGSLLELADVGRQAVADVNALVETQSELLDKALQSLVSKGDLESALHVVTLEELLAALPEQQKAAAKAIKSAVRNKEQRNLLRQARELAKADVLARQNDKKSQRKAIAALKRIAKKYPDSEVAARADRTLQTLNQ